MAGQYKTEPGKMRIELLRLSAIAVTEACPDRSGAPGKAAERRPGTWNICQLVIVPAPSQVTQARTPGRPVHLLQEPLLHLPWVHLPVQHVAL